MMRERDARPHGVGNARYAHYTTLGEALELMKRGRSCVIAKLVIAQPLGETVLAMPCRHRRPVNHVSVPPNVLAYARQRGARWWVVRLDLAGECYGLPIADVEKVGWLKPSDGRPEWFVPVAKFQPMVWQDWPFTERVVRVDDPAPRQPALW